MILILLWNIPFLQLDNVQRALSFDLWLWGPRVMGMHWVIFIRCVSLASTESSRKVPQRKTVGRGIMNDINKSQEQLIGFILKESGMVGGGAGEQEV